MVKLRLVENDYAVLRAYEARSKFETFISIVVQRMVLDDRIHHWGKWHSSAEAKRLGPLAIEIEILLVRDGRTLDDAITILAPKYDGATRESITRLAQMAKNVILGRVKSGIDGLITTLRDQIDAEVFEAGNGSLKVVAQIARALQIEQKLLYRRIERRMLEIREELERSGIESSDAIDLIGRNDAILAFDLGNRVARPSISHDERATAQSEGSQ